MFGMSRGFALRKHETLVRPSGNSEVASFTIGPTGEAVVLWADGDSAIATVHGLDREQVVLRGSVPEFPMAQPLADGRLLVVGMRSAWRGGAGENNAHVYGPDGSVERVGCLGDGIQHVQLAPDGTIWVGYFDEGVYGNLGWGMEGPEPIGKAGIVQFTPGLEVAWEYPSSDHPIDDCYALNVIDDDVWACYYSDFDVVRIRDGAVQHWTNRVEGANAIVVSDEMVALVGGYAETRDRLVIGVLEDDEFRPAVTGRLTMPNGRRIPESAVIVDRGADIHVLAGVEWFTWSVADHA